MNCSRTRLIVAFGAAFLASGIANDLALAQNRNPGAVNAALQAREKMRSSHGQSGTIGGGYRPFSAWTYQNSARMHAQTLNAYGKNCKQLPSATATEHLSAIRQNVAATKAEVAKIGADAAKEADVKEHVDALQKHLAECEQLCSMMEKTIGPDGVQSAPMCTHCSGLEDKLKKVDTEHRALLKKIGIDVPGHAEHDDHGANEQGEAAPATPKKE